MSEITSFPITESVNLKAFTDSRFKTMKIAVDMFIPISKLTAAQYGILPSLVSRATKDYPDYTALSGRLAELYGASLDSGVRKMGTYQVLSLSVSGISSRYALEKEDMFRELSSLLFSVLFDPLKNAEGNFLPEHFEQEKRQLLELKDTEFNDKILYAHQRCEEVMFLGEPAGVDRYGSKEEIAALKLEELSDAWDELLKSSRYEIFLLGDCEPEPSLFQDRFQNFGAPRKLNYLPCPSSLEPRRVTEELPLSQSKLSMGFRVNFRPEERLTFQLMNAVLGGTPSSKLFRNVREKESLCYYCSSSFDAGSRALYVESGVETENLERTEQEVLHQLSLLQAGEVTEEELHSAKMALRNAMRSVRDSLNAVENWCISRIFEPVFESPEASAERLMKVTKEEVVSAANRVMPAAVFCLKGCGER